MTKRPVVLLNAIFVLLLVYHCGPLLQLNKFTHCVQRLEGPLNLYNWKLLGLQSLQCRTVKSTRLYIVVRCGLYSVRLATISSSQQVGSNIYTLYYIALFRTNQSTPRFDIRPRSWCGRHRFLSQ